tara:strand:+ start:797 stop:1516 length:720 start_codon:yes stop_codon:yes gene_type:complete
MAGHSKWANIQHRKGRQDAVRARLFSKFSKEITVAAKMGDSDPDKNPRLRLAVKEAKNNSVPKDLIDRAIKKSIADDSNNFEEIRYEGFAPFGVALIVETLTDNKNRTASNIRSIFTKNGGSLGETGAVSFMFERLGKIIFESKVTNFDNFFEIAIESDAEDVLKHEEDFVIYCKPEKLHSTINTLNNHFGEPYSGKLIWRPKDIISLNDEELIKLSKIIESLEEFDDTQNVFTNSRVV